jgi:RND family efflux transporter MFP subunit
VAAVAAVVLLGCGREGGGRHRRGSTVERLPKLEVIQAARKRLIRRLEVAATVEALKRVELSARVPGIVSELGDDMDIGREVKAGEVLLRLAVPELDADRAYRLALLRQAERQKDLAEKAVEVALREIDETKQEEKRYQADVDYQKLRSGRIRELVRSRAQDPAMLEEATRQFESAEAALGVNRSRAAKMTAKKSAADADLALAREKIEVARADVKKLDEMIAFATVKAPFNGVITRRWVDPGAIIKDPGATLLTVMQMDRVRVLIDVPQRDIPNLNAREQNPNPDGRGDPVDVFMPSLAGVVEGGKLTGFITRVSRSLDPVTRTMRAEVEMDNPKVKGQFLMSPGMYGTASVLVEDRSNVLTVPATALVRRGEGSVEVFCVAETTGEGDERRGVLRRLPVVLGIDDGKEVEIREGLKGTELIVARGNGSMRADDRVIAVSEREGEKKE